MEHNDPEDAAKAMTALERQKRLKEEAALRQQNRPDPEKTALVEVPRAKRD